MDDDCTQLVTPGTHAISDSATDMTCSSTYLTVDVFENIFDGALMPSVVNGSNKCGQQEI